MSTALVSLFLVVLTICVLLNLVMLPGNWAVVGLTALYAWLGPETPELGALFFVALVGMAVVGEVVEFLTQIWGAKKYGSSGKATFAGMIGAIAGAIFFAPFLFGIGAIFGALAGLWLLKEIKVSLVSVVVCMIAILVLKIDLQWVLLGGIAATIIIARLMYSKGMLKK